MRLSFLALTFTVFAAGCSGKTSWKLGPARSPEPVLQRGWSMVEGESEFLSQVAGASQVSYSAPILADNFLVYGSERFGITVLLKQSGKLLWRKRLEDGVSAAPLAVQNKLFVGSDSGDLFHFSLDSGVEQWRVNLGSSVHGSFLYAQGKLFVATDNEALHALDPDTGKILWSYKRPFVGSTSIRGGGHPNLIANKVWIGFSDGAVVSLEPADGSVQFEKQFRDNPKFTDVDAKIIGWKDGVIVSSYDGKLRYMKKDGSPIWDFPHGSARVPFLAEDERIYLPSSTGTVHAVAGSTGKEIWRFDLKRGVPTSIALFENSSGAPVLIVTTSDEKIFLLDSVSGKQLAVQTLGRNSGSYSPVAVDSPAKTFYVLSSFSRVHQFKINL